MNVCECGCGAPTKRRFKQGHNKRGSVWSEEQRAKHQQALTPEVRARIAAASTGRAWSPEQREKMLAALNGHPVSEATRRKLSEHHKANGIRPSAAALAKSAANRGRREAHPTWKGGRTVYPNGYALLNIPDHPRAHPNGFVYEHIVIAERELGRPLAPGEVVHHIDGDKLNNAWGNLMVFASHSEHIKFHRRSAS